MAGQPGCCDRDERYAALAVAGAALERLARVVDCELFRGALEAARDRSDRTRGGRPPYDAVLMFKVLVLQTRSTLSDDQTEYQIRDRRSFLRFLSHALEHRVPDAKTIWLLREQLTRAGAVARLFQRFDAVRRADGYLALGGQIVAATVIQARRPRLSRDEKATVKGGAMPAGWSKAKWAPMATDGRWTRKRGRTRSAAPRQAHAPRRRELVIPVFGFKNPLGIDCRHGFIRSLIVTAAASHDAASSASCAIATTPRAASGPMPPTVRRRTPPRWRGAGWCRTSSGQSPAAGRCRRTGSAATPAGRGCGSPSRTSSPPTSAAWVSSSARSASPGPGPSWGSPTWDTRSRAHLNCCLGDDIMDVMRAEPSLIVINRVGGTGWTTLEYDSPARVTIWKRLDGEKWEKLDLIERARRARHRCLTADEADEAERRGKFRTEELRPGQVLQYGLLIHSPKVDPNSSSFKVEQFYEVVTIVAILARASETGWVVDQVSSVGGTLYLRRVVTGPRVAAGPRITTMRLEVGLKRPVRHPSAGIWHLPRPKQIVVSPCTTDHHLEALDLLPGHHYFATVLLIDNEGRWISFEENFTTLRRRVTVSFTGLEVVNDGSGNAAGKAQLKFQILRGARYSRDMEIEREFPYENGNLSYTTNENHINLKPLDLTHVMGPEKVMPQDRYVAIRVLGTEDDSSGNNWFFSLSGFDESASSYAWPLILPTGTGKEQVINAREFAHAFPKAPPHHNFEFKVTVRSSVEYMA
jgi:hypothetical protein